MPKLIIGSSSEDDVGVGTLLRWESTSLASIEYDPNRELGTFKITEKTGGVAYCFDLMVVDSGLLVLSDLTSNKDYNSFLK